MREYDPNYAEEQDEEEIVTVHAHCPEVRDEQKLPTISDEDEEFKWPIPRRWLVY